MKKIVSAEVIEQKIMWIRGHKVMLDTDLANLYDVETKVFLQSVKRNLSRFPCDFMFQLTEREFESLRSQIGVGSINSVDTCCVNSLLFL